MLPLALDGATGFKLVRTGMLWLLLLLLLVAQLIAGTPDIGASQRI